MTFLTLAFQVLAGVAALAILGLTVRLAIRRPNQRSVLAWALGLAGLFISARILTEGTVTTAVQGCSGLLLLASVVLRRSPSAQDDRSQSDANAAAFRWQLLSLAALAVWAVLHWEVLPSDGTTSVVLSVLWPIAFACGAVPLLLIEQLRLKHPVVIPPGAAAHSRESGLILALGLALVFPVNYLADHHDIQADYSYFRVTAPGSATTAIVASANAPYEALLFYPPGSEVSEKVLGYFETLASQAGGNLNIQVLDQATVPVLAEELGVKQNGYIVLRSGDAKQKIRVFDDTQKAQPDLKKLDGTVQTKLMKLSRGRRIIYYTTGHGEASTSGDDPLHKISRLSQLAREQNLTLKPLGLEQGLGQAVPTDAAMVLVTAPQTNLMESELDSLLTYVQAGGSLFLMLDPDRPVPEELIAGLGFTATAGPLTNTTSYVTRVKPPLAYRELFTSRYGSHPTVAILVKNRQRARWIALGSYGLDFMDDSPLTGAGKPTALIRAADGTFVDEDGNFELSEGEQAESQVMAFAVQGDQEHPFRVIVSGSVTSVSDIVLGQSVANLQFAADSLRWLNGEEELMGETNNEQDVVIEHTRQGDQALFFGTILGFPLLILVAGGLMVGLRKRTGGRQ